MKASAEARTPPLFRTTFVKRVKCPGSAVHFLVADAAMTGEALCGTAPYTDDDDDKKPIWRWVRTVEPGLCQTCLSIACVERMRIRGEVVKPPPDAETLHRWLTAIEEMDDGELDDVVSELREAWLDALAREARE